MQNLVQVIDDINAIRYRVRVLQSAINGAHDVFGDKELINGLDLSADDIADRLSALAAHVDALRTSA